MVRELSARYFKSSYPIVHLGGSLVSRGEISVGELTSLLMYTVYVGNGLQMLTYVYLTILCDSALIYIFARSFFVSFYFSPFRHA
jgi:hypothetical protein